MNQSDQVGRELILASVVYIGLLGLTLMPMTHSVAIWLLPIPLMVLTVKNVRWAPPVMGAIATLLLATMGLGWFSILYGLAIYFMGWSMGEVLQNQQSPYYALVLGTLTVVMLEIVRIAMFRWAGIDLYGEIKATLLDAMRQDPAVAKGTIETVVTSLVEQIRLLTPSLLCVIGFFLALMNLLGTKLIMGRQINLQGLLTNYRLPQSVVAFYVVALTAVLFHIGETSSFWWQVFSNAEFLGGFFIGIQGIAFLWRRVAKSQARYLLQAGIIVIAPLPVVRSIYILIGLFEMMNRVRRSK